jgi:hypothetical protein
VKESSIERRLVQQVRLLGYEALKFVSPGTDGVPDRIVVGHGQVIFVELKTEKGRLSAIQKVQIRRLRKLGQDVRVLYGMSEVAGFLDQLKEGDADEVRSARLPEKGD